KDLRDYFATEVASKVSDPMVIMKLLRHTNLKTTTGYLRTVEDRMRAAVQNLGLQSEKQSQSLAENLGAATGGVLGAELVLKNDQSELSAKLAQLTKLLIAQGFYDDNEEQREEGARYPVKRADRYSAESLCAAIRWLHADDQPHGSPVQPP